MNIPSGERLARFCALAEKRRWKHIDTGVEHTDPEAVDLYERVTKALKHQAAPSN